MFCKNCGNQLGENDLFCNKCGAKQENENRQVNINNQNNIKSSNNKKGSFSVIKLIILLMFLVNAISLCISIMTTGTKSLLEAPTGSTNGLMLIVIFVIACICIIPQIVGAILGIVNLFIKKQMISIFIFIVSLISVIAIVIYYNFGILLNGFGLNLVLSVSISIISLIKMVSKVQ